MNRYNLHNLNDEEFEDLITFICRELMGIGITSFSKGKDGGKDAKFEGTAAKFPNVEHPESGKFIIQAKHTSNPVASCSDSEFEKTILNKEIPKIKRQFEEDRLTHYLLFTNRKKPGRAEDRIIERIREETGVQKVWLRGLEDLERELRLNPKIVRAMGLHCDRAPLEFTPDDIRDVILQLHHQREQISAEFDSEHDIRDYPGIEEKNQINDLTDDYMNYIEEDSMKFFHVIEHFLKNPRNREFKSQYHAVADELKGQLILKRGQFENYDEVLEFVFNKVMENSVDLASHKIRKLLKVVVHYMYVNCEIGRKHDSGEQTP